jgi:DeoR/GlpR family transcriptional regulator of sugar metabolism
MVNLSPAERKAQRKQRAETLFKQGFSQEQIAVLFGVSQSTIRDDLATLVETTNVKGQGKDTLGRKKSTGRPRNSGTKRAGPQPQRKTTTPAIEQAAAELVLDEGKTLAEVAARMLSLSRPD